MVTPKTVVAKYRLAFSSWQQVGDDSSVSVSNSDGKWVFRAKAIPMGKAGADQFFTYKLEIETPGGKGPEKGTYTWPKSYRLLKDAKSEAEYWIKDVKSGKKVVLTGWKKS